MWTVSIVLGALTTLLAYLYWHRRKQHNILHELGIPGPEPHWLLGNLKEFASKPFHKVLQGWTKQYGKIYGYYEGPSPVIITTDLDLVKQVFVKQFASFHSRKWNEQLDELQMSPPTLSIFETKLTKPFPLQADPEKDPNIHMVDARGARWKRLRSIINPTFSSAKMKQMYPIFNERITALIEALEDTSKNGKPFNIYSFFQKLTLDVIGRCAFGMEVNSLQDPTDPFLSKCRRAFERVEELKFLSLFAMLFPELRTTIYKFLRLKRYFKEEPGWWLAENIDKVVKIRRKQEYHKTDLLQLMMESEDVSAMETPSTWIMTAEPVAEERPEVSRVHNDQPDAKNSSAGGHGTALRIVKRKLTNNEIKMQGMLFLLAGYETTSTTLAYTCYELALNLHVQKKLQEEIDEHIGKNVPSYENVHDLPYLDMVLSETLRLYPLASLIVARQCMEPCDVNGLHIPAGVTVQPDVWSIHRDPEIWGPHPDKFDPERFTPEKKAARHPMSWIPFGAGPRNCVGLRFGVMEAKTALIRVLQKFTIDRCEQTEVPLTMVERATVTPKNGVTVRINRRK